MIKVADKRQCSDGTYDFISPIDAWFELLGENLPIDDIQEMARKIDGVSVDSRGFFTGKFYEKSTLYMTYLSTGCKAAILCRSLKGDADKILDLRECGDNALRICLSELNDSKAFAYILDGVYSDEDIFSPYMYEYQGQLLKDLQFLMLLGRDEDE